MLVPLPGPHSGDKALHFERASRLLSECFSIFFFMHSRSVSLPFSFLRCSCHSSHGARRHLEVFISRTFTYPNCQRATRVLRLLIAVTLRLWSRRRAAGEGSSRYCGGINVLHTSFDIRVAPPPSARLQQPTTNPYPNPSPSLVCPSLPLQLLFASSCCSCLICHLIAYTVGAIKKLSFPSTVPLLASHSLLWSFSALFFIEFADFCVV